MFSAAVSNHFVMDPLGGKISGAFKRNLIFCVLKIKKAELKNYLFIFTILIWLFWAIFFLIIVKFWDTRTQNRILYNYLDPDPKQLFKPGQSVLCPDGGWRFPRWGYFQIPPLFLLYWRWRFLFRLDSLSAGSSFARFVGGLIGWFVNLFIDWLVNLFIDWLVDLFIDWYPGDCYSGKLPQLYLRLVEPARTLQRYGGSATAGD